MSLLGILIAICVIALLIGALWLGINYFQKALAKTQEKLSFNLQRDFLSFQQQLSDRLHEGHLNSAKILQDTLQKGRQETSEQVQQTLNFFGKSTAEKLDKLTDLTSLNLKELSQQVEKRLQTGLENTHLTFTDIVKRLAVIDEAQRKMSELSSHMVSLKDLLGDKKSRGAFGEVQLSSLVRNMIPESHCSFQHTLSNQKRADCILFLPKPTGNIVIDAKFPLESYQKFSDTQLSQTERLAFEQQFRKDIKKHIQDISEKYVLPPETAEGAILFIPAEAIFAEIHGRFPDLVEYSHRAKVWLCSPTTLMAILTTVRAVLKDEATRQQVHVIQDQLKILGQDFKRFQNRMENLEKHIQMAHKDVEEVGISARKISSRFQVIEQVQIEASESVQVTPELPKETS